MAPGTREQMRQAFLDEPRCPIARRLLAAEKKIRKTVNRLPDGARLGQLVELLSDLLKLRRTHEDRCPGCGGKEVEACHS